MNEPTLQEIKRQFSDALQTIAQLTKERDELKSKLHQSDLNFDALERQNKHLLTEQSHEENTRKLLQHQMEQAQQERDQLAAKKKELENLHSHALLRIAKLVSREKVLVEALERCMSRLDNTHHNQTLRQAKQALEVCNDL